MHYSYFADFPLLALRANIWSSDVLSDATLPFFRAWDRHFIQLLKFGHSVGVKWGSETHTVYRKKNVFIGWENGLWLLLTGAGTRERTTWKFSDTLSSNTNWFCLKLQSHSQDHNLFSQGNESENIMVETSMNFTQPSQDRWDSQATELIIRQERAVIEEKEDLKASGKQMIRLSLMSNPRATVAIGRNLKRNQTENRKPILIWAAGYLM